MLSHHSTWRSCGPVSRPPMMDCQRLEGPEPYCRQARERIADHTHHALLRARMVVPVLRAWRWLRFAWERSCWYAAGKSRPRVPYILPLQLSLMLRSVSFSSRLRCVLDRLHHFLLFSQLNSFDPNPKNGPGICYNPICHALPLLLTVCLLYRRGTGLVWLGSWIDHF